MRKREVVVAPKRNTRALARRLFPTWTRRKQAEWAVAKLRVLSGTWSHPIGRVARVSPENAPEFLRRLPPGTPLEVRLDPADKVRGVVRYLKNFVK